ncbi:MAG: polymer-forming cytoskeletal protein [Sphingomonadales bacterium]
MAKPTNGNGAKAPRAQSAAPSIIGANVRIKGDVSTAGEIQLDGVVKGDVSAASITMGEQGVLEGTIVAEKIIIRGQVKGSIRGRSVVMERTARVTGDVYHSTLSIEAGAVIEGTFSHSDDPLGKKSPPPTQDALPKAKEPIKMAQSSAENAKA